MGWTPRGNAGGGEDNSSPAPRRRRRRPTEAEEFPRVAAAKEAEPRHAPGARPRGGVNKAREHELGEDTRSRGLFVHVGKRWTEIIRAVKAGEYTWAEFAEGLDEEELARGQLKDSEGGWRGRPPTLVPREFHLACQREMKKRFELLFSSQVLNIAEEYLLMAQSRDLKPETKAKMLQYAMERVFGGIPKDVRVSQEQPWESMVVNVMRTDGETELPDHLEERYARYLERQGGGRDDEE